MCKKYLNSRIFLTGYSQKFVSILLLLLLKQGAKVLIKENDFSHGPPWFRLHHKHTEDFYGWL